MLTYEKITNEHIDIYYNDIKIGHIEKYFLSKYYIVEVDYFRFHVAFKDRKRIPLLIGSLYQSRVLRQEYLDKQKLARFKFLTACRLTTKRTILE